MNLFNNANKNIFSDIINILSHDKKLLNIKDQRNGYTFLFYAIDNRNLEIVVQLLKLGCDPSIMNFFNINCFDQVFINLLKHENFSAGTMIKDMNLLLIFTLREDFNINKIANISLILLKIRENINKKDEYGYSFLHYIIINSKLNLNIDLIIMIIKYIKPDLNNINKEGDTILHSLVHKIVSDFNNIEYFYLLQSMIQYGANDNIYDSKNKLAYDYLKDCFV